MRKGADREDFRRHQGALVRPDHASDSVSGHIVWEDRLMHFEAAHIAVVSWETDRLKGDNRRGHESATMRRVLTVRPCIVVS